MNSTLDKNEPIYIRCNCGTSHHYLCFDYDLDFWGDDELCVALVSTRTSDFWQRLRSAWKHVFGLNDLLMADVIIKREQLKKLL